MLMDSLAARHTRALSRAVSAVLELACLLFLDQLRQEQVLRDSALHDRTARAMADGDPAPAPGLRAVPMALPRAARRGQ